MIHGHDVAKTRMYLLVPDATTVHHVLNRKAQSLPSSQAFL